MKDKKIYFSNTNLSLFKTPIQISNLKIHSDGLKLSINSKYSAIRNKISGNLYLARVNQDIYLYPIDNFYNFKPFEKQVVAKKLGMHLKKDVNYFLSVCEENQRDLEFCHEKMDQDPNVRVNDDCNLKVEKINYFYTRKSIKDFIKNSRIVTISRLQRFINQNEIQEVLDEMCFYLNGRYILMNNFYEKKLHSKRDKLFEIIKRKGIVKKNEINFLGEDSFLAYELMNCDENGNFRLKYDDEVEIKSVSLVKNIDDLGGGKIKILLKKHLIITVWELCELTNLTENVVRRYCESFFKVNENTFAYVDDELKELRVFILQLLKGCSLKKPDIAEKYVEKYGIDINQSLLQKVLKDYCNNKGGKWFLRYDE
ncbi:hypothetical protein DMUE_5424 [Dictyocoela muelleri]|nr:hypothetical protein DMUE_5424 [Dictyocoela muelleri]